MGGFRHEPRNWFERIIHHPRAFATFSVIGGAILIIGTFVLYLNGGSSSNPAAAVRPVGSAVRGTPGPDSSPTPAAAGQPTATPGPQRNYTTAPPAKIDVSATYTATIHTGQGDIALTLDPKAAPIAVNNFIFLAQAHFYDGLSFQRVAPGFVAQAGAPSPDGTGGPGYSIQDENSPLKHVQGAVAMAEMGATPNSAGSQFYVVLKDSLPSQDGKDTVFGQVTTGLNILQALPARDPAGAGQPAPLMIQSITIQKS